MKKKVLSIFLAAVLILQLLPLSALAASVDRDYGVSSENKFYYVALGDSVAAGFGIEDAENPNLMKGITPNGNLHTSVPEAYPNLVANELFETLVENGYLETKSEWTASGWNVETLSSEGQFDYANLGISSFMMEDFNAVLDEGSTHTSRLWENMSAQYQSLTSGLYRKYGVERFQYEVETLRRDRFETYFRNYYDRINERGVASTSSSANTGGKWLQIFTPEVERYGRNNRNFAPNFYGFTEREDDETYFFFMDRVDATEPWLTDVYYTEPDVEGLEEEEAAAAILEAKKAALAAWLAEDDGATFEAFFEAWLSYVAEGMTQDALDEEIERMEADVSNRTRNYQFSNIVRSELAKADLITVHTGANDLLEQFMFTLLDKGLGGYYLTETDDEGTTYYYNVHNALMVTVHLVLFDALSGGMTGTNLTERLESLLDYYNEKGEITPEAVIECLQFVNASNISGMLYDNAVVAMEYFEEMIGKLHELNPDAQLAFVGAFNPFGTDVEFDGKRYT